MGLLPVNSVHAAENSIEAYYRSVPSDGYIHKCQISNTVQYIGRNTMCHVTAVLTIKCMGDLVDFSSLTVSLVGC